MQKRTNLSQKEIVMLNDDYRAYKKENPNGSKTFFDIKNEYIERRFKKDILKAKERSRKVRSFEKRLNQKEASRRS